MTKPIYVTATASQAEQVLQAIRSTFKQGFMALSDFRAGTIIKGDELETTDEIMGNVLLILTKLDAMTAIRGGAE